VLLETASNIQDPKKRAAAQKAATAQSYTRKLRELRYAVALEEQYSKQEILERYLNIAFFGASSYGVEAAAKRYFNTHARDLTLPQAALLAGDRPAAHGVRPDPQPGRGR
jgi:membrane peptidoglycan carboxypeptidase